MINSGCCGGEIMKIKGHFGHLLPAIRADGTCRKAPAIMSNM